MSQAVELESAVLDGLLAQSVGVFSRYTELVFEIPGAVEVSKPVGARILARLKRTVRWPNFAVGLFYVSGASSEIEVEWLGRRFSIPQGRGVSWRVGRTVGGTEIGVELKATFPAEGDHELTAVAGYVRGTRFYYDSKVDRTVKASRQPLAEVPWWVIPLGLAGAGVAVAVGAVLVSEGERGGWRLPGPRL